MPGVPARGGACPGCAFPKVYLYCCDCACADGAVDGRSSRKRAALAGPEKFWLAAMCIRCVRRFELDPLRGMLRPLSECDELEARIPSPPLKCRAKPGPPPAAVRSSIRRRSSAGSMMCRPMSAARAELPVSVALPESVVAAASSAELRGVVFADVVLLEDVPVFAVPALLRLLALVKAEMARLCKGGRADLAARGVASDVPTGLLQASTSAFSPVGVPARAVLFVDAEEGELEK